MSDSEEALADLGRSFDALAADERWCAWLAENIYWASCESFLQTTLLPVFNQTSGRFVTDRERKLDGNWHPDIAIMRREDHDKWWRARDDSDKAALRGLVRGVVQLKVVWTEGNAYGSAVLAEKLRAVDSDVRGLQNRAEQVPEAALVMGVLVAGFHKPTEGRGKLEDAVDQVTSVLKGGKEETARRVTLLDGFEAEHWRGLLRGEKRAWATLVWAIL
jgi:hypothetical protein